MTREDDPPDIEGMLMLVKGRGASGEPHHAYIAIPFGKYEAFLKAQSSGAYDLHAFGTVLHHGEGLEPSREVQAMIEKKYGACHDFERHAIRALKPPGI